jgi:sigma-E factor negative regulatory protein RseC
MEKSEQALECIEQSGRVIRQEGDRVDVQFMSLSACASCNAKGMCSVTEMKEKELSVHSTERFETGEMVTVYMESKAGPKAVFYGFFLPFLVLLAVLLIMMLLTKNEGLSALVALSTLVPYYLILMRMKAVMERKFEFRIRKPGDSGN